MASIGFAAVASVASAAGAAVDTVATLSLYFKYTHIVIYWLIMAYSNSSMRYEHSYQLTIITLLTYWLKTKCIH